MKFETIAIRLQKDDLSESEIDQYRRFCGAWIFTLNTEYGNLIARMAIWLTMHRGEYKSQAEAERAFEATKDGQRMIKVKYRIRAVEALSEALTSAWFLKQREWKETHNL